MKTVALVLGLFLGISGCGGGGDSSADGRWIGIWSTQMPFHRSNCPYLPEVIGWSNELLAPQYQVNQDGVTIVVENTVNGSTLTGQTTEKGESFLANASDVLSAEFPMCRQLVAVQFFFLDGDESGASLTLTVRCPETPDCFIGYVGSASRL